LAKLQSTCPGAKGGLKAFGLLRVEFRARIGDGDGRLFESGEDDICRRDDLAAGP
jgi:hypothetical protein